MKISQGLQLQILVYKQLGVASHVTKEQSSYFTLCKFISDSYNKF